MRSEDLLTIKTAEKVMGGWLDASVTRGVERLPSGFSCALTELYPGQAAKVVVAPFSKCEVYLGADKILTGFIDLFEPSYDADVHQVIIQGRSKTEDLVDCSIDVDAITAGFSTWELRAATIGDAARRVCAPYDIEVVLPDDDPKLDKRPFILAPGMTCFQLIEEMARTVEMLVWDDADGRLVISRVGTKRAGSPLVEGVNIAAASARLSGDQRYSTIMVVAQAPLDEGGGPHIGFKKTAIDKAVPRKRLLMLISDMPGPDGKWAQQRADWENARRFGRSYEVRIEVIGWRDGDGKLWTPNTLVNVKSANLKSDADMIVVEATWRASAGGNTTVLTLMPPQGLQPAPFHFIPPTGV
jgi:prophage tail gpP-like protein